MPIDNAYNRSIAQQLSVINQRFIETFGNDKTVAADAVFGNANKEDLNLMKGGTMLGRNDPAPFTSPVPISKYGSLYANQIDNPLLAENAGLVWNAGKYTSYHDTGEIGEKVEHILIGGNRISANDKDVKEGDELISDEGKAYRKVGGFFFLIAIAIKLAAKAAAKAAAIAAKKAIAAAKAAVKKAVKKKVKAKVKQNVRQKIQDRVKQEIKKEVKGRVKESARERLERLKTGKPEVDNQGFEKIIGRTQDLEALRANPDADPKRIKQKEAAIRRAEEIAHKKGLKNYLKKNRVGKDANFTQADVDKLKREITEKKEKEKQYDLKRAREEWERQKAKVRGEKADAQRAFDEAKNAKYSNKEAIRQKDRDIADLKVKFERMIARKKAERDAKEDKLLQQMRDKEAAQKVKIEKERAYIKKLGTPEQQAQLKETMRKEEEARKEAERQAKEAERKAKEAEEARIKAEKQAEKDRIQAEKDAKAEKERLAQEERDRKEQEAIDYKMAKKEEAHRVGNINQLAPVPEKAPPRNRQSYFGGAKKNARAEVVSKIMKEKGLSMIQASKYVKEHNLY